jgi:phage tail-like protein
MYDRFRFRVRWEDRHVAGFNRLALPEPQNGTKFDAVTLDEGLTNDSDFANWAAQASKPDGERRDLRIDVYDEAGVLVAVYKLLRTWVSEYQALPELDANANEVAIETLKIENEGYKRDDDVPTPYER